MAREVWVLEVFQDAHPEWKVFETGFANERSAAEKADWCARALDTEARWRVVRYVPAEEGDRGA